MLFKDTILTVIILILVTGCGSGWDGDPAVGENMASIFNSHVADSLVGEWNGGNTLWSTTSLILKKNGTFTFYSQDCYRQFFSKGRWANNSGMVILTSFDDFKQKALHEVNESSTMPDWQYVKDGADTGSITYLYVGFDDPPVNIFSGKNDTVRTFLNKVQLRLKNDTLYSMAPEGLPEVERLCREATKLL